MTPGRGGCTASALPRNNPVPIAPPIAIMLSWPVVSWRESCSCSSIRSVFCVIGRAGASRRMENAEQPDGRRAGILKAVDDAIGQINARTGSEVVGVPLFLEMQESLPFEAVGSFFVGVVVERRLHGRG